MVTPRNERQIIPIRDDERCDSMSKIPLAAPVTTFSIRHAESMKGRAKVSVNADDFPPIAVDFGAGSVLFGMKFTVDQARELIAGLQKAVDTLPYEIGRGDELVTRPRTYGPVA